MQLKNFGIGFFENMPRSVKVGLIASFLLLLTVNIVFVDLTVFMGRDVAVPSELAATTVHVIVTPTPEEGCSLSCIAKIDAIEQRIDSMTVEKQTMSSLSKEYYIPLGSGTTKSNVWQDIAGTEVVIDTANYPRIKTVVFEVFVNIPTANGFVSAKLYNVTDKHDVWFSEVRSEGSTLTKKEAVVTLESGAKTYRVLGLSSLKYDANIQNARIRIITY